MTMAHQIAKGASAGIRPGADACQKRASHFSQHDLHAPESDTGRGLGALANGSNEDAKTTRF